jgi:hypothetical protein
MSDYSKGKIYKVVNDLDDEVYVGKTCQTLNSRFGDHKSDCRHYVGERKFFVHLQTLGIEHFRIELIEDYPCETKAELEKRETYWIETLPGTLNTYKSYSEFRDLAEGDTKRTEYMRQHAQKRREKLREDPKKYKAFREKENEMERKRRAAKGLAVRDKTNTIAGEIMSVAHDRKEYQKLWMRNKRSKEKEERPPKPVLSEEEKKERKRLKDKEYREKNKEKIKERRDNNKEINSEKKKNYCELHKEKKVEYYQNNKDKIKAYQKEYREKNKDYFKEYREKNKEKLKEKKEKSNTSAVETTTQANSNVHTFIDCRARRQYRMKILRDLREKNQNIINENRINEEKREQK